MKVLYGCVALLAMIALGAIWFAKPAASGESWENALLRQQRHAEELDFLQSQREAFAAYFEETCADYEHGEIDLAQAANKLLHYSEMFYPVYLEHLEALDDSGTPQERVARNILRQFERTLAVDEERLHKIEQELSVLSRDAAQTNRHTPVPASPSERPVATE